MKKIQIQVMLCMLLFGTLGLNWLTCINPNLKSYTAHNRWLKTLLHDNWGLSYCPQLTVF